ncbi:MAG: carboxypeptidase-like regulatory domain-containing protein [Acidobacteriota bacterium]
MKTSRLCQFLALLLLVTPCGNLLHAQSTGRLTGVVIDPSQALIPEAKVLCRNTQIGLVLERVTSEQGTFTFPELPVGHYEIQVTRSGFQTLVRSGVEVLTGRTTNLDLSLRVGEISDKVEVVGQPALVQTTTSAVETTVVGTEMRDLPLNGRNALQLVVLTPGASFTPVGTHVGQQDNTGVTVNGLRATENNYLLDGASYNNLQFGSAPTLPNPDTLEEFTVKSSNFSAQHSQAGAVVQLSTRAGTNQFHGTLFEFLRNDKLDARNFFAKDRPPFRRNQYGGTFGGPIIRDKAFIFASYQGTKNRGGPSPKVLTVASDAQRRGDFSNSTRTIVDPESGQPFPNNIIPESRLDSLSLKLLPHIPLLPSGQRFVTAPRSVDSDDDQLLVRVDYNLSDRHRLDVRYFYDRFNFQRDTGSLPNNYALNLYRNHLASINDTYAVSSSLILNNSLSYTRTFRDQVPIFPVTPQQLGAMVPLANDVAQPELRVFINGYFNFFSGGPLAYHPDYLEYRGNVSWTKGTHLLQFGADVRAAGQFSLDVSDGGGLWFFTGDRTSRPDIARSGDAFADFLLGLPNRFLQKATPPLRFKERKIQLWLNDDWKIHRDLTLNVGLRWEPWFPPTDEAGPLAGFVPGLQSRVLPDAPQGLIFAGAGVSDIGRNKLLGNDLNNFGPRFGFAWKVFGDDRTVVRGGFGVYYQSVPYNVWREAGKQVPFRALSVDIPTPPSFANPYGGTPLVPFTPPSQEERASFRLARPVTTELIDPNIRMGYTQSWNFTIERQVMPTTSLSVSYVGNHSVKGVEGFDGNPAVFGPGASTSNVNSRRVFPELGRFILYNGTFENANYHALQVTGVSRSHKGLTLVASYVWSRTIDILSGGSVGGGGTRVRNPFNPQMDRGPANYHRTHLLRVSAVYPLPRFTSRRGLAAMFNDWQLNAIVSAASGLPFTVRAGRDRSLTDVNLDHADVVGNPVLGSSARTLTRYFDTSVFRLPALGTFGTSSRNALYGPGEMILDLSLFKDVRLTERLRWQFRLESFNALNRANFGQPDSNFSSGNFGRILSAGDPRVVQIGLKLIF